MTLCPNLLPALPDLVALVPLERINALKHWAGASLDDSWTWYLSGALLAVLAVVVPILLAVRFRREAIRERKMAFQRDATRVGLTHGEGLLLEAVAKLAALDEPAQVFVQEEAFTRGIAALMSPQRLGGMERNRQKQLNNAVITLCQKLGFALPVVDNPESVPNTHSIPAGAEVCLIGKNGMVRFDARVQSIEDESLVLEANSVRDLAPSEPVLLRYSHLGAVWEFDATLLARDADTFRLAHAEKARDINLRRFPRVPIRCGALVSAFPFFPKAGPQLIPPPFWPATVVEIGGTGLRLQCMLGAAVGDSLLVVVQFPDGKVVQDWAKVHRLTDPGTPKAVLSVELMNVKSNELAELLRQTNLAAVKAEENRPPASLETMRIPVGSARS